MNNGWMPDHDTAGIIRLAMGSIHVDQYRPPRPSVDAHYVCGKRAHDAAVARRRKRKRGGPK